MSLVFCLFYKPSHWAQTTVTVSKSKDTGRLQQAPRRLNLELLQVPADEFRHLEHRHLLLAAEYGLERVVSVDHASVLGVLQLFALDVGPELLRHFGARHGFIADHRAESGAGGHRFHECGIRFPLRLGHRLVLLSIELGAIFPRERTRPAPECVNSSEKSTPREGKCSATGFWP